MKKITFLTVLAVFLICWQSNAQVCTGFTSTTTDTTTFIDNVSTTGGVTNISNLGSGLSAGRYQDNFASTGVTTSFSSGSFSFSVGIQGGTVGCAIWVDWNGDFIFNTVSEKVFNTTSYGNGPFTGTITVPPGTANGDYYMRIMIDWNDPNPDDNPCSFEFETGRGEVEDYKVTVTNAPTDELDYYNLQWPPNGTINAGATFDVYAQAYEAGLTDVTAGQAPGILSWIGYSRTNTNPNGAGWTWVPATFNSESGGGNNDEYMLNLGALAMSGTYYYASRWSLNGGPFTYGGIKANGDPGGVWGADNNISGVLTVNAPSNDDCSNATMLAVASDLTCTSPVSGTTIGANQSLAGCTGTANDDVWYSFIATSSAHTITITNSSGATDIVTEVFDSCGGTSLLCQDTPNSPVTVSGLISSNTYYFRIYTVSATESVRTSFDVCVGTPPPPPSNDNCATATMLTVGSDLSCSSPVAGTTIDATQSLAGCVGTADDDVWYSFVATGSNHSIIVNNTGGNTDIVTQVFDSCGGASLVCQDTPNSPINLTGLVPSTTYYFRIYTYSSTTTIRTSFTVCVGTPPAPPANDTCAGALPLAESANTSCANAVSGTTVSATPSASGTCSTSGKDVWYAFIPLTTGNYNFSVSEVTDYGTSTTYVTLYSGECGSTTQIGTSCTTTSISDVALTASTTYYVVVRTTSTTAGVDFSLCAYPTPPPPVNDTCEGALTLTESADSTCANVVSGTTVSATPSSSGTCSAVGKDVWYAFTPSQTNEYIFGVTETQDFGTSSTYLSVYSGSCGSTTQVGTGCSSSSATLALTAGTPYYVVVRSTSTTAGVNFNLCAYPKPPVPANDACSGANVITALPYNFSQTDGISATNNDGFITACNGITTPGSMNDGLWFTFTPDTDGTVDIVVSNVAAAFDPQMDLYSGSCGTFTCVASADSGFGGGGESILAQAVTAGTQYFINVGNWSGTTNNPEGSFDINVSGSITLGVESIENTSGFTYFPNPVKNTLNLKAQSNIQNVSVYNMLGQEVLRNSPNSLNSEVSMASLQTGAYFVKVTINDAVETIRVIKQ